MEQQMPILSVAIIGSFRQHYDRVVQVIHEFRGAGWSVTSPVGADVIEPDIQFVRFESDNPEHSDEEIQTLTLKNIFSADLVYVVCPGGYIGRTTCYEVGRIIQARRPIYFSEKPKDLPISVGDSFLVSVQDLVSQATKGIFPVWLFGKGDGVLAVAERELVNHD
ncbi:hypothetical protein [Nitrospirillum amazonense]|uniref:hypothetical protein n=1 Tax=Nitrospirillum amazonense TaxID=28077 RepID=UPI002412445C|nr:hypothetical protein [Nitrospirillum amazonense]MDG3443980.1 hypothetical protein [Nitrospirillum amazonense]